MTWEDASIEVLGLSTRLNNVLRARGVVTLGKLMRLNRQELSYMPYLGPSAVVQILHERERFLQDPEGALRRRQEAGAARQPEVPVITAETPLAALNLPSRPKSSLRLAKIRTLEGRTVASLMAIKELGRRAVRDILRETAALSPAGAVRAGRTPVYVNDLYLSMRARRSLEKMGVRMISELCAMSQGDLTAHRGIGRLILWEIEQALLPYGLRLAGAWAEAAAGLQGDG